jgi:hypothetical protein
MRRTTAPPSIAALVKTKKQAEKEINSAAVSQCDYAALLGKNKDSGELKDLQRSLLLRHKSPIWLELRWHGPKPPVTMKEADILLRKGTEVYVYCHRGTFSSAVLADLGRMA